MLILQFVSIWLQKNAGSYILGENMRQCMKVKSDDDHYGRATITEIIGNHRHIFIDPLDITRHLMRFSEDNDCVFHTIYNEIKDFRGYKRYTIEKLKQEFIGCGINITDGVCFEDIKKWHSVFKHHISFYFFNPNFILVEKVKGYEYNYKTPQILLMYNNNHCYTINNNDIKNSVVYGNVTDLNQFNPATTFEIKAGDNYTFHTFNEVSDDIINNNFKEGVLFVEPRIIVDEMGIERFQTFLQFVHWLLTIDRTQINFIDFDKNCVYFNNILIFVVKDFNLRKGICDFLKRETESLNFNFKNQSYGSITMNWFNERYGYLKKSCYNNKMRHFVDEYYPEPVHLSFSTTKKWSVKLGIDYPKSYPNAVVKYFKDNKLPVLNICDDLIDTDFIITEVEEDKIYLIDDVYFMNVLYCKKSLCPYFVVNNLLKLGIKIRCLGYSKYNEYIDGNKFVDFTEEVFYQFPTDGKNMLNSFYGLLNCKWSNDNNGFITTNNSVAVNARINGFKVDWEGDIEDRVYVCRNKSQSRLSFDHCLLNQCVIWCGILNLMEIHQFIDTRFVDYEITGANTDAVYFGCNKLIEQKNNGQFYDKNFKIGEKEYKNCKFVDFEDREYQIGFNNDWTIDKSGSHFNYSIGGSTKTTSTIIENKDKRILCLAFENNAVCNMKMVCEREKVSEYKCMTIHRALGLTLSGDRKRSEDFDKYDVIILDELFRIQPSLMCEIYTKLNEFTGKLVLIGDPDQNGYICENGFTYDYTKCDFVGDLTGFNKYEFTDEEMIDKIKTKRCRYNLEIYNVIKHFKKYKNLDGFVFKKIDPKININIVRSNKLRKKINDSFSKKLKVGDKAILINNNYLDLEDGSSYAKGYTFTIKSIGEKINGIFNTTDVEMNYAFTTYRSQGGTIEEPFNIYEVDKMNYEELFTALTRTRCLENIHLDMTKLKKFYKRKSRFFKFREIYDTTKYGIVYEASENGKFYIGMTSREKEIRFDEHTKDPKSVVYKFMTNPVFRVLGKVVGGNKLLEKYEREYIVWYKKMYGNNCINKTNFKKGKKEIDLMEEQFNIGGYRVLDEEVIKKGSESSGLKFKISDEVSSNRLAITCLNDKKKIFIKYKKIGKEIGIGKSP